MRVSLDHVPPPFRAIFDEMNAQGIDLCSMGLVTHGDTVRPNMAIGAKDMTPETVFAVDAFKRLYPNASFDFSTLHFMNMPTQEMAMPMTSDGSDICPMGIVQMPGFLCMDTRMLTSKTESGGDNRALKHFKSPKWRSQPHVCPHMAPVCHYRLVCEGWMIFSTPDPIEINAMITGLTDADIDAIGEIIEGVSVHGLRNQTHPT